MLDIFNIFASASNFTFMIDANSLKKEAKHILDYVYIFKKRFFKTFFKYLFKHL